MACWWRPRPPVIEPPTLSPPWPAMPGHSATHARLCPPAAAAERCWPVGQAHQAEGRRGTTLSCRASWSRGRCGRGRPRLCPGQSGSAGCWWSRSRGSALCTPSASLQAGGRVVLVPGDPWGGGAQGVRQWLHSLRAHALTGHGGADRRGDTQAVTRRGRQIDKLIPADGWEVSGSPQGSLARDPATGHRQLAAGSFPTRAPGPTGCPPPARTSCRCPQTAAAQQSTA